MCGRASGNSGSGRPHSTAAVVWLKYSPGCYPRGEVDRGTRDFRPLQCARRAIRVNALVVARNPEPAVRTVELVAVDPASRFPRTSRICDPEGRAGLGLSHAPTVSPAQITRPWFSTGPFIRHRRTGMGPHRVHR